MRIGLIGVGRMGIMHAETLHSLAGVESVVIADADQERARKIADDLGEEWAASAEELIGSGVDGVVIATPTKTHSEMLLSTTAAGIPTFCEKPLGTDMAQAIDLVRQLGQREVAVQIGFQRRFDAGFVNARNRLLANELGWLHSIRSSTLDPAPPPAAYIKTSGGIFRDCSVHDIDAIRWVSGQEVTQVYAVGSNRGADFFREADDVDTAAALLTLEDGTLAYISATRYNGAGHDVRLELFGSEASVGVGFDDRLPMPSAEAGVSWPAGPPYTNFLDRFRQAYAAELAAFVEVAAGRQDSACLPADALETFYVAEACELSRRQGRPVDMEELRP